ncbi:bifunctional diaminohydroxyphosphoribosylaminopyrimidine deaminase/5-amino-6-(5-phosphoribosylamino)uracil reductase RibD [Clostridium estertheticum]|uniref:bifunctional diaminohydroxyphosphoribosylaminopyrimidine deaminase/5-amino-6-(5-phosphoribosylamino)uracil reductase RibD n=1 Tax=Clostridium estertheticum TaxID=238834 RepID=UPI001C7DB8DA|nr:bifunctional diaminohydroxyphosphoribosylaminopyrimidine deaminase/5-amino-6-(5-phosphoribosylamino)uracil reductase RibD [Clostridium estertheticum]MBX4259239.1 bifunctional diaminohydroxyphosphoribosylaminopyrimidine deaminase/5-amino-6-(5-phosphoribosylamino)uracil reductase RibD [Clostridium estertheticum]WLC69490.1 bifunctional diaminohydroxyphosphoribosylaminopyrimidine deaminase/5-amino-6-(5-phosphoribosylamino)uracil reductase RibD [Clostridium estertheticum]
MDNYYMSRALELSKKALGFVNPNPLVGAVIVKDNRIIGEGYHEHFGGPHAEVNAFENAKEDVEGATMYVTLEPCAHYGKTPPCAEAIVKNKIAKVIVGMIDPNPLVAGKGVEILRKAGIEVTTGIMENEIRKTNEIFIKYITTKNPFCIMKTAMTLDGKIATTTGDSKWISNEKSRAYVHELRNRVSGIMVGIGTVLSDNPELTTRREGKTSTNPVRIIIDSTAKISLDSKVLKCDEKTKTIIVTTKFASDTKICAIKQKGAEVIITPGENKWVNLNYLMKVLGDRGIDSILLEGGSTLNYSALDEGIIDKVITFISPKIFGGTSGKTTVGGKGIDFVKDSILLCDTKVTRFDEDIMIEAYVKK